MAAFANGRQLHRHFSEHGNDFGAADAFVYEAMADRFLTGTPGPTVQQCVRVQGDVVRFDTATGALGVIDGTNIIRTFMVPIPCSAIMDPVKGPKSTIEVDATDTGAICYIFNGTARGATNMINICPVCGYLMEDPPKDYNICPSCGTEFGYHDLNSSIAELRAAWLRTGPRWWSRVETPSLTIGTRISS